MCDHGTNQFKAEIAVLRETLGTLRQNTLWTAFGAIAGWLALILVVIAIL